MTHQLQTIPPNERDLAHRAFRILCLPLYALGVCVGLAGLLSRTAAESLVEGFELFAPDEERWK